MIRKIALAAAIAAFAVPAFADSQVTVNVAGLDAKAAHAVIVQAAQKACRAELADQSTLVQFYTHSECITSTVNQAEAKFASMRGLASR
jgi:UrcA family protein